MSSAESRFLEALLHGAPSSLPLGPGDDAAQLPGGLLAALDTVVEGVHFESSATRHDIAYKALAACESDLCAMGARGRWALLSAQLPPGEDVEALAEALRTAAAVLGLEIVGGDTTRTAPGSLALAVTILGPPPSGPIWRRAGGQAGDELWVSGALGGSRSGRHLRPRPRHDVVERLRAEAITPCAAMDLSDGLGVDLVRLCAASELGAVVDAEAIPIHADVSAERDPLAAALGDGEDFELLLALPPGLGPLDGLTKIGMLSAEVGLRLRRAGQDGAWPKLGFEHEL